MDGPDGGHGVDPSPQRADGVKTCKKPRPGSLSLIVYVRCRRCTVLYILPRSSHLPTPFSVSSHRADLEKSLPRRRAADPTSRPIRPSIHSLPITRYPLLLFLRNRDVLPRPSPHPRSAVKRSGANFLAAQPQPVVPPSRGICWHISTVSPPCVTASKKKTKTTIM